MNTHKVNKMCAHASKDITIEGWGSPSPVQNVVKKIREDNQNVGKIGWTVNQTPIPKL